MHLSVHVHQQILQPLRQALFTALPVHLCQPIAKVLCCGHPQRGTAYSVGDSEYLTDGAGRNERNIATQ
jgi:hypothetical protein